MIRVSRGTETERLRRERRHRLSRAILTWQENEAVDFEGYGVARAQLADRLNHKCIYCECWLRVEGNPVEHFRPKAHVQNKGEPRDEERYWWLAWSWENLLFACGRCNSSYKRNQFPLQPGTPPLPPLSFDLDSESPLLVDPAREDPRAHIRFKWSDTRKRWLPVAKSLKGQQTIEALGLDDDDKPTDHLARPLIKDALDDIESAVRRKRKRGVQAAWNKALKSLFAPKEPFHAVTWDAMDARFPESERRKYGVALPVLGDHTPVPPSLPFDPADDPPALAALPDALKVHVRANPPHASKEEKMAALRALLAHKPFDDEELADFFDLRKSTIQGYRRELRKPAAKAP